MTWSNQTPEERAIIKAWKDNQMTGPELYARRVQLDYSQAALARLLGVATLTVSRWERGKNRIPLTAAIALKHVKPNTVGESQ